MPVSPSSSASRLRSSGVCSTWERRREFWAESLRNVGAEVVVGAEVGEGLAEGSDGALAVPASTGPMTLPTAALAGSTAEDSPLAASTVITASEAATISPTTIPWNEPAIAAEAGAAAVVAQADGRARDP